MANAIMATKTASTPTVITIFFVAGYVIGYATGNLTADGFELKGGPAFLFFAAVIAYFVVFSKYLGGTLWQRILNTR